MCSVLEHLEKTSTEHFDFAEHEREHRAPNFTRAPSTLIIAYNISDKNIYRASHLNLSPVIDRNFWTNKDRAKRFSLKWTLDLGKTDGWRCHPSGAPYTAEKAFAKASCSLWRWPWKNLNVIAVNRKFEDVIILRVSCFWVIIIESYSSSKKKHHLGPKRVTSRNPYQSIDLIEYYKSYNRYIELRRGRQALEGAKVNFFLVDFLQFLQKPFLAA